MKYSLKWIKEYVDIDMPIPELFQRLTLTGSEVEGYEMLLNEIQGIKIAKIKKIESHPQADKLQLCQVSDGKETYSVVCGATNIKKGQTVPLALVGAALPGGVKIKRSKIRGVESQGMLCSKRELGMGTDHEGIFILEDDLKLGKDFKEYFDDLIFEVEVTPNRPDLLSHFGMAREIAAVTGKRARDFEIVDDIAGTVESPIKIEVRDIDACPRYLLLYIKNIKNQPSPDHIKEGLIAMGSNPKGLLVDLSNFNLFETGHPTHFFDADKVEGNIIVRFARKGEKTITLDGIERTLTAEDLVIADEKKIIAIAGVMGCENSVVSDNTVNIAVESAIFNPSLIRKTRTRLGINSDASYRYERGVDIMLPDVSLKRLMYHFRKLTTFDANSNVLDQSIEPQSPREIVLKEETVEHILGVKIDTNMITEILSLLGFKSEKLLNSSIKVSVPSFRLFDVEREIDLIEEVGRIYSYENIPAKRPYIRGELQINKFRDFKQSVRKVLASRGFNETHNLTVSEDSLYSNYGYEGDLLSITNPLNSSQNVFAPMIFPRMINTLIRNMKYRPENLRLFEIARVYTDGQEKERLSMLLYGKRWRSNWITGSDIHAADLFDLIGEVEMLFHSAGMEQALSFANSDYASFIPGRAAKILLNGSTIGYMGEVDEDMIPSKRVSLPVIVAEFDLEPLFSDTTVHYEHFSQYPSIERDLALVFPIAPENASVLEIIGSAAGEMLANIELKDVYPMEDGSFSMMYRLVFRSKKKTLKDKQIDFFMNKIITAIEGEFDAKLR